MIFCVIGVVWQESSRRLQFATFLDNLCEQLHAMRTAHLAEHRKYVNLSAVLSSSRLVLSSRGFCAFVLP